MSWILARKERTMNRHQGTRLARCARWLGLDRNPLRRRTDRIEAAIRMATLIFLLTVVPVATFAVGRQVDHIELDRVHAMRMADHQVTAVLLQQAPLTGVPDPYSSIQMTWTLARWQPPGQRVRSGQVLVPTGSRAGSTVTIWIGTSGAVTSPPPDSRAIAGDVCVGAVATCLVAIALVLGSSTLARRALDRRRLRAWDTEWRATGPLWTNHHS
jgi:hypothetical protein